MFELLQSSKQDANSVIKLIENCETTGDSVDVVNTQTILSDGDTFVSLKHWIFM